MTSRAAEISRLRGFIDSTRSPHDTREGLDLVVAIMVRKAVWKGEPGYPVFRDLARNSLRFHEFMKEVPPCQPA